MKKYLLDTSVLLDLFLNRLPWAADMASLSLTILDNDVPRILTLSPRLKILGPNGPGKMEDIVPGAIVDCGLHPDRKQIEVVVVPAKVVPAK